MLVEHSFRKKSLIMLIWWLIQLMLWRQKRLNQNRPRLCNWQRISRQCYLTEIIIFIRSQRNMWIQRPNMCLPKVLVNRGAQQRWRLYSYSHSFKNRQHLERVGFRLSNLKCHTSFLKKKLNMIPNQTLFCHLIILMKTNWINHLEWAKILAQWKRWCKRSSMTMTAQASKIVECCRLTNGI